MRTYLKENLSDGSRLTRKSFFEQNKLDSIKRKITELNEDVKKFVLNQDASSSRKRKAVEPQEGNTKILKGETRKIVLRGAKRDGSDRIKTQEIPLLEMPVFDNLAQFSMYRTHSTSFAAERERAQRFSIPYFVYELEEIVSRTTAYYRPLLSNFFEHDQKNL